MCNINILGVWKYVQHSFVHDSEARFACPVCDKRIIKVQNFKDHIMRHQLSSDTQTLAPTTALQVLKKPSSSSKLEDKKSDDVTVEGADNNHTCTECGRHFANATRLEGHMACHLPKEDWSHNCPECHAPFPNVQRLKLHVANVHSNTGVRRCELCNAGPFANRHLLQVHMAEEHNEEEQQQVLLTVVGT